LCDVEEKCNAANPDCPTDTFLPANTTVCRPAQGPCDQDDYCIGNATCPDYKKPAFTVCDAKRGCWAESDCDGLNNECPPQQVTGCAFTCCLDGFCTKFACP
jgi:hypothetical protein